MELYSIQYNKEYGPNKMGTSDKLSMLIHVLYKNRDLFVKVTQLRPKTFVLTPNKMFVILKYTLMKSLKLCLYTLERVVFV